MLLIFCFWFYGKILHLAIHILEHLITAILKFKETGRYLCLFDVLTHGFCHVILSPDIPGNIDQMSIIIF